MLNKGFVNVPAGRPTDYNLEIAKEICDKIASCSIGMKKLCASHEHWPHLDTFYMWLRRHKEFAELYARAKIDQVSALVDEIIEISDDSTHDTIVKQDHDGNDYEVCNSEFINRSRLRVDTRKWIAAKLVPRLYGDNVAARELAEDIKELKESLGLK